MLKAIVDKVPEGLEEHYEERDGKFVLAVEAVGGYALEDIAGLRSALSKERSERKELDARVRAFGELTPEAAHEALERIAEFEKIDPKKEADKLAAAKVEATLKQLGEKHRAELTGRDERIKALSDTVDSVVRRQRAAEALAKAKGSVELLMPHILSHTRTVENDGRFEVEVVDDYGNVMVGKTGQNMNLEDFVAELRLNEAYGRAFDASGNNGSGKDQRKSGGAGPKRSTMSADEKMAYLSEHGQEAYLKLPV